jgi:uncharacterized small protein (DUF1192 family)
MAKKRNRSAQDLTLINLRALKARVTALERAVRRLLAANRKKKKKLIQGEQ